MNCLVLGSSGQIGHVLLAYLNKIGHQAVAFDLMQHPEEDLRVANNGLLLEKMTAADFVFFLAFDVGGSRYLQTYQHTLAFLSNNIRIMEHTFAMLHNMNKPFIFTSSQMSNMMYSPYGQLKALGERYTAALGGLVVKFWNVYGVEQITNKCHVITDFLLQAKANNHIRMLTSGEEKRQFLYVEDSCKCLTLLAEQYNAIPKDKNLHITSFVWHSILEVANVIKALYPTITISPGEKIDETQGDKRNEPDPFILTYWQPHTTLDQGIQYIHSRIIANQELIYANC